MSSQTISSYGTVLHNSGLGWLHTEGRWIKNAFGQTVRLTGCSWLDLVFMDRLAGTWPAVERCDKMAELRVNMVTIQVNMQAWREDYPGYRDTFDNIVNLLGERNIYVELVVAHDATPFTVWTNAEKLAAEIEKNTLIARTVDLVNHYKDNPTVAMIDILNEPAPPTDLGGHYYDWGEVYQIFYDYALACAQAINAANPNILIAVGSPGWCRIMSPLFRDNPLPVPNIVYVIHHYYNYDLDRNFAYALSYQAGNFTTAKEQLEAFLIQDQGFMMLDKGYPVIVNEHAGDWYSPNWNVEFEDEFKLYQKYDVGFQTMYWWKAGGYSPGGQKEYALLDENWRFPSPQGEIWTRYLAGLPTL